MLHEAGVCAIPIAVDDDLLCILYVRICMTEQSISRLEKANVTGLEE